MRKCRVIEVPIPQKIFIVRPVSAVRPSSVTDNLRGRYHSILGHDILLNFFTSISLHLLIKNKRISNKGNGY